MKKMIIIAASIVVALSIAISIFFYWLDVTDPASPNRYPEVGNTKLLKDIPANSSDKYLLVRWNASSDTYDIIDDYNLLLNNKDIFSIKNKREAHFTTCEIVFSLYKNGEKISSEICDETGQLTVVDYGTLENKFIRKDRIEFENMLHPDFPKSIVDLKVYDISYKDDYKKIIENLDPLPFDSSIIKKLQNAKYHNDFVLWKGDTIGVAELKSGKKVYLRLSDYGDFFAIADEFGYYSYNDN